MRAQPKASHGPADCDCSALGGSAPSLATFPPASRSKRGGDGQSRFPAATHPTALFLWARVSLLDTRTGENSYPCGRVWPASQTMPRLWRGFKVLRPPKTGGFAPCSRTRFLRTRDSRSSEPFNGFAVLHFVPAQRVIGSALRLFIPCESGSENRDQANPHPAHTGRVSTRVLVSSVRCLCPSTGH